MATPARERGEPTLPFHPVVDVLDDSALGIEAKHRGAREGQFPPALDPACPPLDRRPITCRDGSAE